EKRAIVMPRDSITRAGPRLLEAPGIGTKTNTPETRTNVSKNPSSSGMGTARSPRIAAEIAQNRNRVRRQLLCDPWQRNDQRHQEGNQAWDRIECRILDRSQDLDQAN